MIKNFFKESNIIFKEEVSLKNYNTYRIDTTCKYLVFPQTEEELITILKYLKNNNIKYFILGNGSNIIFSMDYYDGVIIKLDKLNYIKYDNNIVTVGAGYPLIKLSFETIERGLSGLEFSTGIPGSVGGSIAMNAGAYNSDIATVLKQATVLTPNYEIKSFNKEELQYEYRNSFLKKNNDYIVLNGIFELSLGDVSTMKTLVEERKNKRQLSQPLDVPSAGSVFRNPEGMHAGALIEQAGLKGYNINDAEVSVKHANFIVNKGTATGKDIIELINKIKKEIKEKNDIDLILEQIIVE